jgi:group I intron endonuclease
MGSMKSYWIYAITNLVNGKLYIGQHYGENLQKYLLDKFYRARRHNTRALDRAIRKYGEQSFVISPLVRATDKSQMDKLEIFFIRTLETQKSIYGYNMTAGGGGHIGEELSRATRDKISASLIGNKRRLGIKHTEAARLIMSQKGRGRKKSLEHRIKIGLGNKGKVMPTYAVEKMRVNRWLSKSTEEREAINQKISKAHTGKTLTKEHKENLSKSQIGIARTPVHTEETKQKLRDRWSSNKEQRLTSYHRGPNGRFGQVA